MQHRHRSPRPAREWWTDARRLPWLTVVGALLLALVGGANVARAAQPDGGAVHVAQISGPIDLGIAPYLDRVLTDAEQAGASAVLLEIDTPGGRLDAVLQMQDALVGAQVRTIAFVDRMALSAGALTTIAAEDIYLAPGATLGAATPVLGDTGEPADEKTVSAVAGTFRATAEARGRDPQIAAAMVDPDIAVEGVVAAGELLALSAQEAEQLGYADGIVADRAAVLEAAGSGDATIVETAPGAAESVARFLTNPIVASLLITLALWLLIADLVTGGIGLASAIAAVSFVAFFWGHLVAGLAGWEDMLLVAIGLGLIAVELLVVPGVGLPGLLGLAAVLAGLFMAQLSRDLVTPAQLQRATATVAVTFFAVLVGLIGAIRLLGRHGPPRALVLDTQLGSGDPVTERATGGWVRWFGGDDLVLAGSSRTDRPQEWDEESSFLLGRRGVALSDLRPSGIADLEGQRIDVVTGGEYIPAGEPVEVVSDEGYRRVVRRSPQGSGEPVR